MRKILGFRVKLIPTLFTIPALILLFSLSYWQFQRLELKENLIKKITSQIQLPAVLLPEHLDLDEMLYRKVILEGEFIHEHEVHMYGGSIHFKGGNGYYILTPLRLKDGRFIIVNRGWVPENIKDPKSRPEVLTKGLVKITGAVMKNEEKGLYIHDNQPKNNLWFYINLEEIGSFINLPIESFYILSQDDGGPILRGRDIKPNLHNNHLGYALTWLFSGISLLVIYILYHRRV